MDKSLVALCDALKKIVWKLKPQHNALSFLLLIGKDKQGKSTLLRQSHFQHFSVDAEKQSDVYYNQHGVIVELDDSWLNESKHLLQHTLKQLNRCHRNLLISGIILCVDISEFVDLDPPMLAEINKSHIQILQRFGSALGYRVDAGIIFTKMDCLAGFSEFFQNEHDTDLSKPLGFSIHSNPQKKFIEVFRFQFDQLIEMLGQQVIHKMHPARSSVKRTLIREFPLQLASLRLAIQTLLQGISPRAFQLDAIYFTSAEQGGVSVDRLNKKIKHEYALSVQDKFPQAVNYRAYFIEGALLAFQAQTKRLPPRITQTQKLIAGTLAASLMGITGWVIYQHVKSSNLLDEASKELLMYEAYISQKNTGAPALYHLSKASDSLKKIKSNTFSLPTLQDLKVRVQINAKNNLTGSFVPQLLDEVEQVMIDSRQTQSARYQALKVYLMLGNTQRFNQEDVLHWFDNHWRNETPENKQKKLTLLHQIIQTPFKPVPINQQVVNDIRNYLNALPPSYLYYSLAKGSFPEGRTSLSIDGFDLSENEIPIYFTKAGFKQILAKLPAISAQLQKEDWILGRDNSPNLEEIIKQAYCYEYVAWWQNFMHRSNPMHFQDYQQARSFAQQLHKSNSINKLVTFIQQQTSPDLENDSSIFNQEIASKFTAISLLSNSSVRELGININELDKFLTTLSLVNDHGKTAFTLTKARFEGDTLTNPLSTLYARAQQLPEPVSLWMKQIADDTWFILINDSRTYINQQWQETVFQEYQNHIAKRYPFEVNQTQEVALNDFDHFFGSHGTFTNFFDFYIRPFLDTSRAQWQSKEVNNYILPISAETLNELMRVNVITNMFFPNHSDISKIEFTLQKVSLDPVVGSLELSIGNSRLYDDQSTESFTQFSWPQQGAKLALNSIEGNHYELEESGAWALFKMLQKVNVLVDEHDSSSLQILFEVNGNSGRYVLKTQNQINPFIPGILNGFFLNETIV
ncbi:IcmF [Legionella adelaidensis]|uniref:IcmF n=1 Tax=Legionella adelaidensis TaxID=45056 RepID=A0A0W0R615_9GAMM|nr:type IVB secretion system protein IcmF [Legionella adelaidensis]KTC66527.1 IcmF [Legionella adelaidensis]